MTNKTPSSKQKVHDAYPKKELFLFEPRTLFLVIITSVLTLLIAFFGERGTKFFTSVLSPIPAHAPFDGTVYPLAKVPNWVKFSESDRKAKYSEISKDKFISTPFYNPSRLAIPVDTLEWNNAADDAIRNEKIVYSVPYLGSYKFNGIESEGSHPAVDIKIPEGTPINSIANGTVIKAETGNGGFGSHIVIQHNNVPSLNDKNILTTIYSSYSHLSSIVVKVNDVVTKGQLIGFSGVTGTATTPHLHFQIDNESATFHPYWPFNSSDMKANGYSFFQAIDKGLGQGNAVANTINPLKYIQKYYGDQNVIVAAATTSVPEAPRPSPVSTDPYDSVSFMVKVVNADPVQEGSEVRFVIQAFDAQGTLINKPAFKDTIKLSLARGLGKLNRDNLTATNLRSGITSLIKVMQLKTGRDKLILRFRDKEFSSPEFEIAAQKKAFNRFTLVAQQPNLQIGQSSLISIRMVDENGTLASMANSLDGSVRLYSYLGTFAQTVLNSEDFINGEAKVTYTATKEGQERLAGIYRNQDFYGDVITITPADSEVAPPAAEPVSSNTSLNTPQTSVLTASTDPPATTPPPTTPPVAEIKPTQIIEGEQQLPFSDVPQSSPYFLAITSLKADNLVVGYGDLTFKPEKEVSRAEAIAFVLKSINEEVKSNFSAIFSDVQDDAWYGTFVTTAHDLGFVKGYSDGTFRPNDTVNLAEFFTMIFVGAKTDVDPQVLITLPSGIAPSEWYTPYLQEAVRKNILVVPEGTSVDPTKPLTRGEIAQIVFRIKKWEKENTGGQL